MALVLLVEDDPMIYEAVAPYFARQRWDLRWVRSVSEAKTALADLVPDVVLLDRGLPGRDGDALTSDLANASIPFIMLTARTAEPDRLGGFDLGADDYITKPFSVPELLRRVEVVVRRRGAPRQHLTANVEIDREARIVRANNVPVQLTTTEFDLVAALALRPGRVYSRAELVEMLGLDLETSERTLDSHVKNVRAKIRNAGESARLVRTIIGVGYALEVMLP